MIKNKKQKSAFPFSAIFIIIEFLIVQFFLSFAIHFTGGDVSSIVSFNAVLSASVFAIAFFSKNQEYLLIQLGLIFTVCADVFLVLLNAENKVSAMIFFSLTQICYFLLLYKRDERLKRLHLIIRAAVVLAAIIAVTAVLGKNTDTLSLISLFYYANLAINVVWAFIEFKTSRLFALGLLFFALCDACIGFSVMDSIYISLSEGTFLYFLANPGFNLAWAFYVPSQTLIALSLAEINIKAKSAD